MLAANALAISKNFTPEFMYPKCRHSKNARYSGRRESLGSGELVGNVTAFIAVRERVIGWRHIFPFYGPIV